jgi:NADH-quinone oxidoreductase subunit N|uniref:NADH dehydrogenase subunit 2 n=1 Tax=Phaeodactylum tricornutum TaxID=2850 RepID=F1DGM2_PHATR|nr:NADH dehydrogenase subunit 2 [Phaeodactylum tricornutum]ADY18500.1 NADH dehydrogenase subunit 2 [Phaeodactylum tricornutum]
MLLKPFNTSLYSVVFLQSFTVFPEHFIAISAAYILIVASLIVYKNYSITIEKALGECLGLILAMTCYLISNDELLGLNILSLHNAIVNDYLGLFTKFTVCFFSSTYFFLTAESFKEQRLTAFEYLLVLLFAVLGLILLCSSNDLLTAYLAIELTSLASYILASFRKTSNYSIEAGIKYFITGAVSSAFFLLGSSILYAVSGSIHVVDLWDLFTDSCETGLGLTNQFSLLINNSNNLAFRSETQDVFFSSILNQCNSNLLEIGLTFVLFSLFIKLALAPFHFWSLDVYEGSPTSSTFFFAVLTKLSLFVFLTRLCYTAFFPLIDCWQFYSLWVGVFSVFVGSFGGLKQRKLKTLLAYSSTSHMGYSLLAFSSGHVLGIRMLLFYLIIYMIAGACTWFIILLLRVKRQKVIFKYTKELGDLVLLNKSNAGLALSLAVTMFSIAGLPPLIGFFAKMGIFLSLLQFKTYTIPLLVILCSVVSTFYYIRIVKVLYFENLLVGKLYHPLSTNKTIILSFLLLSLVLLFINPNFLFLLVFEVVIESFSVTDEL